jgi:prepilin-type N-terminal cleavage/methylation domain-containing protein
MTSRGLITDERGVTLVELMVALAAGLVILVALTTALLTTMHTSARVAARVEATQRARIALVRLTEELHSACLAPEISPVKENSTGNLLKFVHQTGSAVQLTPVLSVLTYSGGTLSRADYANTGGTAPNWTFAATPSNTRILLTHVAPIPPGTGIFSYYRYANGTINETSQATPLSKEESELTVEVRVALVAAPTAMPVHDEGASAYVQNSATLRLTPPSFNEGSPSKPCV